MLTTRRAWLAKGETGRLLLTERRLEVRTDRRVIVVPLADVIAVRRVRRPRALLEVRTAEQVLRLRCFAPGAVAALVQNLHRSGDAADIP